MAFFKELGRIAKVNYQLGKGPSGGLGSWYKGVEGPGGKGIGGGSDWRLNDFLVLLVNKLEQEAIRLFGSRVGIRVVAEI